MPNYLFTSESVGNGHPDKVADQISDAILDECLRQDPNSKVACEALVSKGLVVLAGEITTKAIINYEAVVRDTVRRIGYTDPKLGFDYRSCAVLTSIHRQSPDIAIGVEEGTGVFKEQGAGDQGIMFGFACDETKDLMPLPITLAHSLMEELRHLRELGSPSYLRPDAKSQVTVEYTEDHSPSRIHTVVISTQHTEDVDYERVCTDMKQMALGILPAEYIDDNTLFYINPTGRFVTGGPLGDCGLTGRKTIVDTYGGMGRHGGGAFSGKDPSKVDRSASYAARYVAKNVVAAGLARRCEVQLSYAIGVSHPISVKVDTFGTQAGVSEADLALAIPKVFDLSPKGIIEMLDLKRPIFHQTAHGGHFGKRGEDFTWERVDKVNELQAILNQCQVGC